jgi:4'-phosphopantetheinyl transferase
VLFSGFRGVSSQHESSLRGTFGVEEHALRASTSTLTGVRVTPLLWRVDLCQESSVLDRAAQLLSSTEHARLARQGPELRRRRTVLRAALRLALARWLGRGPETFRFVAEPAGKPRLAGEEVHFSVSSSGEYGLIALTQLGPVGVDIERVKPIDELEAVALRCFGADTARELVDEPAERRAQVFYRHWTMLEAQLKASGVGLAQRLDCLGGEADRRALTIATVDPGPGYAGAIAVGGRHDLPARGLHPQVLDLNAELACA